MTKLAIRPIQRTLALLVVLATLLAACGNDDDDAATPTPDDAAATTDTAATETEESGEPLRIGVVTSLTGPYQLNGQEVERVAEYVKERFPDVAGHPLEIVIEDDTTKPEVAVQKAERLALEDKVSAIIGPISSPITLAVGSKAPSWRVPVVSTIAASDSITGTECNPFLFRVVQSDSMDAAVLDAWLPKRAEKTWFFVGADYEWGHAEEEFFKTAGSKHDKEILGTEFAPLTATDFAPIIAKIQGAEPEAIYVALAGNLLPNFIRQAREFGLQQPIVGAGVPSETNTAALGDLAVGGAGMIVYNFNIDTPKNERFVADWRELHGRAPGMIEGDVYLGFEAIFAAVEKANSTEGEAVAEALRGLEFDSIIGRYAFNPAMNQLVRPLWVGEVKPGADGTLETGLVLEVGEDDIADALPTGCEL